MKYNMTFRMIDLVFTEITRKAGIDACVRKNIRKEYRAVVDRAEDIGSGNTLLGAYAMMAYFIAMNRFDGLTPEENCRMLEKGLAKSRLYKLAMGSADNYFSEKKMEFRRKWARETHEKKYRNDWVVNVLEKTPDYEFGFDYLECGVCKLGRDEACPELARYLCRLDYMTTDMMGVHLERTMTLAEGCPKCDFRFSR